MIKINALLSSPVVIILSALIFASGCSEEAQNTISGLSDLVEIAENMEDIEEVIPSTYTDHCMLPLGDFMDSTNSTGQPSLNSGDQVKAVALLKTCLLEMQAEIDLTIKQFPDINKLAECKKNLDSSIADKPEIMAGIEEFASMKNQNSEDSLAVAMAFSGVYLDMVTRGGKPAMNRSAICILEKVVPEHMLKDS